MTPQQYARRLLFPIGSAAGMLSGILLLQPANFAEAETKAEREATARSLVRQGLECEIAGQGDSAALITQAKEKSPDYTPARWQSGQVFWNKQWLDYEQVAQLADYQSAITEYGRQRSLTPATVEGQMSLADWCAKQGLVDQQCAHLTRVLDLEPNHAAARTRLGYVRIGDRWLSRREMAAARERDVLSRQAVAHWKASLEPINAALHASLASTRNKARERLSAIRDPQAIPALEMVVSSQDDDEARAVVETIAAMSAPEASVGLARLAVFTPWYNVGEFASQKLKGRDEHSYIPLLLAALYTPAKAQFGILYDNGSVILQRYSFFREGQDRNQRLIADSSYGIWLIAHDGQGLLPAINSLRPPLLNGRGAHERDLAILASQEIKAQAEVDAFAVSKELEQKNEATQALNERICRVLSTVTGEELPPEPTAWWSWWNDRNEVYYEGQKPTDTVYIQRSSTLPLTSTRFNGFARCSCLVAGTEVWTDSGPRAIEKIQTGDRVLSQHPDTGELAYRAVLRPTKRKPAPLTTIQLPRQTIRSTGGHPFWVVGQGWAMARELKAGMRLHSPAGAVEILATGEAADEPTFNLIVADFHSYFVGPERVLSHDNTIRVPTHGGLPGFATVSEVTR